MCLMENDKFVRDEVLRSKLENVAANILREILAEKEVSSSNYLKLRTILKNLGFKVPEEFQWESLWDSRYACEDGGLAKGDNIYSYYFKNRKSIRHVPEWLCYPKNKEETLMRSFVPMRALAAEWFMYVIDKDDLREKLTTALKFVDRNQDFSCMAASTTGVEFEFDFVVFQKETLMHQISISSLILPTPITVEQDADAKSDYQAAYLIGVLEGYFGYIAGVYK